MIIIDYGVGNLFSLSSSLRFLNIPHTVTGDKAAIAGADKLILPGVGAFGDAAKKLHEGGYTPLLRERAAAGVPIMGICLGMQLLFEGSEEFGQHEGLGLIRGRIAAMRPILDGLGLNYKLPQMGWNALHIKRNCRLLKYTPEGAYVYYVHSFYAADCGDAVAAVSDYGLEVPGVVERGNICGCQFHPEKSGGTGLNILKAFAEFEGGGV